MKGAAAARPRILLVDDNQSLAENLAEVLEEAGYAVRSAGSCAAAEAVAQDGFDVALVDLRLPDGDGTALAPRLKELSPDGEVVLLTGFATLESAVAAVRAGACAYLVKPCATHELLVTVEQAMRQVRLHGEKRELARKAQMAEKLAAVGTMTAGLSHEIRNPLNAAVLQLTVLERRLQKLPAERPGAAPRAAHPGQGRDPAPRPHPGGLPPVRPAARVRAAPGRPRAGGLAGPRPHGRRGGAAAHPGGPRPRSRLAPPAVAGDEERLRQVLVNLALNALEATPDGGEVRVACAFEPPGRGEPDDRVAVTIEDTRPRGAGDLRHRIFEPFFTTKAKGSGLGLSIVHAIVVQHGGALSVEEGSDGGARFVVRLPVASGR